MSKNRINLIKYLDKGANIIYYISICIILLGYLIDTLEFRRQTSVLTFLNIFTIFLVFFLALLYIFKIINLKTSYGIILYATIANIFIESFMDPFLPSRLDFLMRDAIFVIIVLSLASLVIHKIHSIIISSVYLVGITAFTLYTQNVFLKDSIYLIFIIVMAYGCVVYYFVSVIEKAIKTIEEDSQTIKIQNDELNKLIATKNKFFSILAHDLKNPFNTILGFSDLLELKYDNLDDTKRKKYIENIKKTSAKTYSLLENLLLWARTQSDYLEINPRSISFPQLVEAVMPFFEKSISDKNLKIKNHIDEKCIVYADMNHIEIVLKNILSNAIRYSPHYGTITLDYHIKHDFVDISIADSGIGMSNEEIATLFNIEKNRKKVTIDGESGTGLGLIICNELIFKNGGVLSVSSKPSKGSVFTFSLPKAT